MSGRHIPIGLSTASVYPEPVGAAFELAGDLGYDGVEVMVWADPVSQDMDALLDLSDRHGVPVLAVHAPCLLISQRVWSPDPVIRLRRAVTAAQVLDAPTVVVHPPFRWQRRYADRFTELVEELNETSGIAIAVENMFPVRLRGTELSAFKPSVDPTDVGHRHYTLDLSHTAAAQMDPLAMAQRMGKGLVHVHLADGSGAARDEHLVPGRGIAPCATLCEQLAASDFSGQVVLEVNTRKARGPGERAAELAEALLFARLNLGQN
ncbi:sugar phosphate isomerase/epimerase family protein [Kutzneria kofuensis]|uniref:Sugar phosphate isomerase/epimerase n=1 Tax=Kutzneria kofuensis TaxID=103725 RepID=A0A7W9KJN2_9PSEU|nr:sugar phosphate isomerase/epimerase [Kutzneria kofuensis]MBB5893074.1 sugar phosphate isomerase/epimerase [Kutzneria kofuensis]